MWTDHPGFGASLAKLGHPTKPDRTWEPLRSVACWTRLASRTMRGTRRSRRVGAGDGGGGAGQGSAVPRSAGVQLEEHGGVHALEEGSLEMVEVADALEVLTKTSNWRLTADDRWTLAENKEVCGRRRRVAARAVVPTPFGRSSGRGHQDDMRD